MKVPPQTMLLMRRIREAKAQVAYYSQLSRDLEELDLLDEAITAELRVKIYSERIIRFTNMLEGKAA